MPKKQKLQQIARYADMLTAMGTESRLRIMQLLLSAHPEGLIVGEIGKELEIPSSTLSHHLEKLKNEDLVKVRREGTFLWYSGQYRCAPRAPWIFVRGMLHPQQGYRAAQDCLHLLSARRVGPTGKAYGLDMTDEMLALAEENKRRY